MTTTHSNKAFWFAIIAISFLVVFFLLKNLVGTEKVPTDNYTYFSAFTMLLVVLFSFIGFIYNLRGLKEPRSWKKVSGLIINSIFMLLFVITTIANVIEFLNYSGT